ncbi:Ribose-phosphate pyrophosphokinase [hydrothermal vent metagenome]|uniref:ribose-phosphate diphosphokinase n=1 Tax=hydrothermal vent metagenome TaxID=652676 RepID=A0A1W1BQN2_9ZZZZ
MSFDNIKVFSGNANHKLAEEIMSELGIPLGKALVSKFSDGESRVEIQENVRGMDVFVIQSTCPPNPNDKLMELLVIIDALKRASAKRITVVVPYFGYSRQDRPISFIRSPITAKLVASMISVAGVNRVLTVDLHADQIQGFFDIPVDNIFASELLVEDVVKQNYEDIVVVSPDVGGVVRARAVAKKLDDASLVIIDKRRPAPNKLKIMNIIGNVENKTCIIFDDIIDTAGTLCQAADVLKEKGAKKVVAYITHPVLSANALEVITNSSLNELVVTNTIPLSDEAQKNSKIRQLSFAKTLSEIIIRIHNEKSVSSIFV